MTYFTFIGFHNRKKSKSNVTIFLIYCDQQLLNHIASILELEVYNREKKFLEAFIVEYKENFE